jgi:hypothetical protein
MAKAKADRANGSIQAEQIGAEQPAVDGAVEMPPTAQPGEQEPPGETSGTDALDEPGPEDFERHSGAKLIEDHAADLALAIDVERRIRNRAPVIAQRAIESGAKNPIVKIGDRLFAPRKRPEKDGGGTGLAEIRERTVAVI